VLSKLTSEEVSRCDVKALGEAPDHIQGGVAATCLDVREIGTVHLRSLGELLLGPVPAAAESPNAQPEGTPVLGCLVGSRNYARHTTTRFCG